MRGSGRRLFHMLDEYLSGSGAGDYWSDEGIQQATVLIQRLDQAGWIELRSVWSTRSDDWQSKLAEILSFGDSQEAIKTAVVMIDSKFADVRVKIFDSIREMDLSLLSSADLSALESVLSRELECRDDTLESRVLYDLAERIELFKRTQA